MAVEAYDLSSTPPPLPLYDEITDDEESVDTYKKKVGNRKTLLDFSLDVKSVYDDFIKSIKKQYGDKRADRFTTWVKVGYIEQFHSDHRRMIKWDRKELRKRFNEINGSP